MCPLLTAHEKTDFTAVMIFLNVPTCARVTWRMGLFWPTDSDEAGEVLPPLSLSLQGWLALPDPSFEYLATPARSVILHVRHVAPTNVVG